MLPVSTTTHAEIMRRLAEIEARMIQHAETDKRIAEIDRRLAEVSELLDMTAHT